jgi:hypothetical protein
LKQVKDFRASTYCLMALWGILHDAEAAGQMLFNAKVTQVGSRTISVQIMNGF